MSSDDKKPNPKPTAAAPPSSPSLSQQASNLAAPVKNPLISRRTFVIGALSVSALLTVASVSQSGAILGPLLPTKEGDTVVSNWNSLNSRYTAVKGTTDEYTPSNYSDFFYYPYPVSDSPYYKNVITRLPDPLINPLVNPNVQNYDILKKLAAFNLTCVHLRCIVNPGYAGNPGIGEFRLQCPCHGSQYRLTDAVPVAGPAFDLGLLPLPRVDLKYDAATGNIVATNLIGDAGIGRSS